MLLTVWTLVWALASFACAGPSYPHGSASSPSGITNDSSTVENKTFDYVICGGGLSGLTVASRLTEDPQISVLVIENGYDNHLDPRVSDVRTYGEAFGSELDYNITSTPIKWQNGTGLQLVAGRTLGGSASINGASWTKGASSQYDLLPLLTGDDSWAWEPFNEYMMRAEHFNPPDAHEVADGAQYNASFHGEDGPVQVSFAAGIYGEPQSAALEASYKVWKGLVRDSDAADGDPLGATIIPDMVDSDEAQNRSSPFTAFILHQIQGRDNLHILTGHRAVQIVWKDAPDMVAEGVHFQSCRDCPTGFVAAAREVLLAAGSLQSPQILELSGVGDPDILAAAGVPLKLASQGVGKHMQEQTKNTIHVSARFGNFNGSGPSSAIAFPSIEQMLKDNTSATYDYVLNSLAAYAADLQAEGFVANKNATLKILQAQVNNLFNDNVPAAEVFYWISDASEQLGIDYWNLIVMSRGTAHIKTNNSWDHPIVESNYFAHPLDLMLQRSAAKQTREAYQTEPLASYVDKELFPGPAVPANATEAEWEAWVLSSFTSVWHYIATLSMMKKEYGGVVDSRLKIYDIENVRAIDASVLPIQLSAHLCSSLYGIAEKAAAMIKEDQSNSWSCPPEQSEHFKTSWMPPNQRCSSAVPNSSAGPRS